MLDLKASIAHCPHRRRPPRPRDNLTPTHPFRCLGHAQQIRHVLSMLLLLNCLLIPHYKPLLWLSRLRVSMVLILALSHSV